MRPVLFSFGSIEILAAPVFAGFAAIAAAWFVFRHREHAKLTETGYWDLMLPMAIGTMAGGALLYIIFYGGGLSMSIPRLMRTYRISGGTFYGNLLGALLTAAFVCRRRGLSFRRVGDLIGPAALLGLAIMRLGCFQRGCCYGRPTSWPWAVTFTDAASGVKRSMLGVAVHPSQLYEAALVAGLYCFVAFEVLPRAKDGRVPAGSALLASIGAYAAVRFLLDFARGGDRGILRPGGLTTAQLLSVLLALGAAGLWTRWSREPA